MKLPFVLRSRYQKRIADLQHQLTTLAAEVAENRASLQTLQEVRERELEHLRSVENLCEDRRRELERLHQSQSETGILRRRILDRLAAARAGEFIPRKNRIPVVLGVDVEPDGREVNLDDPSWRGTDRFFEKLDELRASLAAAAGGTRVPISWFPRADPQVQRSHGTAAFALQHFDREWERVLAQGDEIGLHMHPWRWNEQGGHWVQDHGNDEWMEHCLHVAISEFRHHFGKGPAVYRGGDHYLDDLVVRVLESEGVLWDMGVERLESKERLVEYEHGTGMLPDCSKVPEYAYRPSVADFRVPDPKKSTGLGILPLTFWRTETLCLWLDNSLVDEALEELVSRKTPPTHLAFVVRSNIADSSYWETFVDNALSLARRVKEGSLQFVTASQAGVLALPDPPHPERDPNLSAEKND